MSLTLEQVLARSMRISRKRAASVFGSGSSSQPSSAPPLFDRRDDSEIKKQGEFLRPPVTGLLARNSQDLLMTLQTDRRLGDWVNALETYDQAIRVTQITPNLAHFRAVVDTLVAAEKYAEVELFLDQIVASASAADAKGIVEHVVDFYAQSRGLDVALALVERHRNLVSAGAFAACVRACEKDQQWQRAMDIVCSMRGNVLLGASSDSPRPSDELFGPVPDAVTYASLINVLEQSGKNALASEVLSKLPGPEKEAITASYAALVHVWAERLSRRKRW